MFIGYAQIGKLIENVHHKGTIFLRLVSDDMIGETEIIFIVSKSILPGSIRNLIILDLTGCAVMIKS
jgi:hypothetical protein